MNDLPRFAAARIEMGPGCWRWTGAGNQYGYGHATVAGRGQMAHRYVYELLVGPIPSGMDLDHRCHNNDPACTGGRTCAHRRCVNPAHLEPVTHRENMRRSRNVGGSRRGRRMKSAIESSVEAKAGRSTDLLLREMYVGRRMSHAAIGAELGVSREVISKWMRRYGIQPRMRTLPNPTREEQAA